MPDEGNVIVETPICPRCGKPGVIELTYDQYLRYDEWKLGKGYIQSQLPELPAATREQLKTGYHPACFEAVFARFDDA